MHITETLVDAVAKVAVDAGGLILPFYKQDLKVYNKSDGSPVLDADLAANALITKKLTAIDGDVPVVSEEDAASHSKASKHSTYFWLVDPLDGTKEFINQNGEFTVNIALIEHGKPILGVVYAPALDVLYLGSKFGAFKREQGVTTALAVSTESASQACRVLMSRSHEGQAQILEVFPEFKHAEFVGVGSSLKFCKVAEGLADYYPRVGRTMEWDTAAGHAVVLAAGGVVNCFDGSPLTYGKPELKNPSFLAKQR